MQEKEIEEKVLALICKEFSVENTPELIAKDFVRDLRADSLDTISLIMMIEDEFGIMIPNEEAEALMSPKQVVEYIYQKLNG